MKLDENERGNQTRLMKVKDMILAEKHSKKSAKKQNARIKRSAVRKNEKQN